VEVMRDGLFMIEEISSLQNRYVKLALHLQKKREREKEGQFLIDGYQELCLAMHTIPIEILFYCPRFFKREEHGLLERFRTLGTKLIGCTEKVFSKISYRENPDGLLGIAKSQYLSLKDLKLSAHAFYLIAENLEKPGNLGAILRTADASGASGVIVVDGTIDIFHPNVIRSSVGAIFSLPIVLCKNEEALDWIKNNQLTLIAATPEATLSYSELQLKKKLAFVVGSEHQGLSPFWKTHADYLVKIPMTGKVNSLNVSVSAALLLFEAKRWMSL
jgi:RNA methyltransferase, TrmH family